jgi:uncharacterized membrane protein AbrB (regulator of aidB expression)
MPIPKEVKTAVGVSLVVLFIAAPVLVNQFGWLFAGHILFGLTVGLMVGMTRSSIVSGVLPLLFTFAGGSIVALSIGDDRTPEQLDTLGRQLTGFGFGTSVGVLFGIILSKTGVELPLGKFKD